MRHFKFRLKVIWVMLTNGYTYNERLGVMWLWTKPVTTLVLRPVADADLDLLLEQEKE